MQTYLDEEPDKVTVYMKETNAIGEAVAGGEIRKASAKYVIGADGANSMVRSFMPHEFKDLGFSSSFYVVDVIPKVEMEFSPRNLQICDPKRPTTLAMAGPGRRRWEFMLVPGESKEEFRDVQVAWNFLKPWNITPENADIERHVVYTFNAKWVKNWRQGRLILTGDAAHLTPPFLGQGLSSGIRDAANIAWKLDLVLQGKIGEEILDTYSEERVPHMATLIEAATHLGKIITVADEKRAKERDDALLNGTYPPLPALPDLDHGILYKHGENKLAGTLSLQAKVKRGETVDLFDNVMGNGWKVISLNKDAAEYLDENQKEYLQAIGAECVTVVDEATNNESVVDADGKYAAYFAANNIEAVIVRPDFYVYAGVEKLADLGEIVANLMKQIVLK